MKKLLLILCMMLSASSAFVQNLPTGFVSTSIASGWSQPVGAVFSSDGQKLFIWEKEGRVYVCIRNGAGNYIKQTTPVLDIREEVGGWRDHGLLGFALDPAFETNGNIYLLYVVDRHHLMKFGTADYNAATNEYYAATIGRVTRYQTELIDTNVIANTGSRAVLLGESPSTGVPILYESHSIGGLAFAADGTLLVSTGDGASYSTTDGGSVGHTYYVQALLDGIIRPEENVGSFRAQLLDCHGGKLLRINPLTGDGLPSNPYYDPARPRAAQSKVWALGFRNPFRISVRPGTGSTLPNTGDIGEVYVGDVGWNVWEELNIIKKPGMNCGWPLYEGHTTLNSYFNLNRQNPEAPNPLFNGTTCNTSLFTFNNLLKQATADDITTVYNPCDALQPIGTANRYFHARPALAYRHGSNETRIGTFNGNNASTALIGSAGSGTTGSSFQGNCAVAGTWYTGDAFPEGYKNTFFMADLGGKWLKRFTIDFTDKVTRVDNFGSNYTNLVCIAQNPLDGSLVTVEISPTGVKKITFGGNRPPTPVVESDKTYGPGPLQVSFTGNKSSDADGTIASYLWNFDDGNTSTDPNPVHSFTATPGEPRKFRVSLTVTDNDGGSTMDTMIVSVNNTPPLVHITSPEKNSKYTVGVDSLYECTADVSDAEHGPSQLSYSWQTFLRHNNHEHAELIDNNVDTETRISRIGCNGDTYYWHIELTVTDAHGLVTIDSSQIFPQCAGTLPLTLRKFSVSQQSDRNLVKWTTELEANMDYFEIERSSNGILFLPIHREKAKNLAGSLDYSFNDLGVPEGVSYYRLKMVEHGNVVRYSVVVRTRSESKKGQLKVSPNPVVHNFSVTYEAKENGPVRIVVYDMHGRQVTARTETVSRGANIIYIQNEDNWRPGLYLLTIQQGAEISQGRFIKAE